jgi:outer membrane receptor for ferrienterochelin and colicins
VTTKKLLQAGAAALALATADPAFAQTEQTPAETAPAGEGEERETPNDPVQSRDIIVTGQIVYRQRTVDPNPVLSYELEYFQRFEPVSVGEMLKRVPGVTFTSDVLEYDGVQMRGLPPGFTQVLINGRRAPGGESDRSFFVDRIPAELVERIEIVRAPRADQPSEGVAGTLNVITKESTTFDGGFVKLGSLINQDGGVRPSGAIAYADTFGDTSLWGALNYQKRRNPKKKVSLRYSDEPTVRDTTDAEFDNTELQDDTRDGRDLSGNAEVTHRFGDGGFVRVQGFFVDTKRDEDETSTTFEGADLEFDGVEIQHEDISQQTYAIAADSVVPLGSFKLGLAAGWSGFRENTDILSSEGDNEDDLSDVEDVEIETLDIHDDEYTGTVSLSWGEGPLKLKGGIDLLDKKRRGANIVTDIEDDEDEIVPGVNFTIREKRYDPYVRLTLEPSDALTVDAGVRYEITRRRTTGADGTERYDTENLNPSLHLRYALTGTDQLRASIARTVRRPNYDLISPYEQEESPGDDDTTVGNPALRNERAWGIDVGYERRLPGNGIAGVNGFYRDVSDLTELTVIGSAGAGQLFTPRNIGDGKVWGVEVDLSTPLGFLGLPDTGLFANYTYLDSSTRDPFTGEKRRFNNQPHHVYNLGFIQTVRAVDASFGATVSGRSKALESNFDETVELTYTPDLEAFVEKRIGRNIVIRGTASNLLNRKKRETFRKYDGDSYAEILENRAAGDLDEFELERERSGRLFQVTLRAAF